VHQSTSSRRSKFRTGSIALSLGLCLCAGQLVATQPAAAATTPVVTASAAAERPLPKVTQSVSARTIAYGKSVRITSKWINPETGKAVTGKVRLQAYRNGWKTWQTGTIRSDGSVTFYSKPLASVTFRTAYTGGGSVRPGISSRVLITVKASGAKVVAEASKHKGALYKYGATGPSRFDCSGFTLYVYRKTTGRKLPHKANSQQKYGKAVSKSKKQVGDLIVYRSGSYGYHAAIYAGNGRIWDSPHSGARVSKRKMFGGNYVVRRLV
jgi:peptidoglycan DL-endopeptidase CwlO